jgi:TonB-linked SusC/RagA family outer membrane protein
MKKLLLTCCIMLIIAISSYAQVRTISGTVTDKASVPLEAVTVTVEGGKSSALTDAKGKFSIQASVGQTLKFSYVGSKATSVVIKNADNLSVVLDLGANDLNEVVVTGYTSERKKDLTGAVTVVKMADIQNIPAGNPIKALQGRVPGLTVTQDGSPNGAVTVRMRGQTTLNISSDPLYVIDGIPTQRGLQEINQNDVESIQVLKDASAASIYGSRAAAGVVIVTTKKGKNGTKKIDVDASTSVQYYNSKISVLNTEQHGRAYWQAVVNDDLFGPAASNPYDPSTTNGVYKYDWNKDYKNPVLNKVIIPEFVDAAKTMKSANTSWFDEISQPSILQQYNLSASNGGPSGTSFLSLGYFDNQGIIKKTRSQKITARANVDYNFFNGRLKIGENLNATYFKDAILPTGDITNLSIIENPIIPVHTVNGGWGGPVAGMDDRQNPVRLIDDNQQNHNNFGRILSSTYIDLNILPGLNFKTSFDVDYAGSYYRTLLKPYQSGFLSSTIAQVNTDFDYSGSLTWQNILTYDVTLHKHKINALLGAESINNHNQGFNASAQGLAVADIDYAYLTQGTSSILANGSGNADALQSYFGKVNYSYNDKYLASATLRRDGSSKFGANNRYAYFPAASVGWRISQESFMKALPAISDLKLRYSWGQTGNQSIPAYATYSLFQSIYATDLTWNPSAGSAYDIDGRGTGTLPSGFTATQTGNPDLKWETTTQSNFGIDFGLFGSAITGSLEYYVKNTKNILLNPPYLGVVGEGGNEWINGASLQNKGIEAIISYNKQISNDLSIGLTGNISHNALKITYLPNNAIIGYPGNGTTNTIIGRTPHSYYGWVAEGLFTTQAEVDNSPEQPGKGLGRIRYADLDGNGVVDNNDQKYIGTSDPDFVYGLNTTINYKNFDLSFFFQGVKGGVVSNSYKSLTDFTSLAPGANWGTRVLDAWTPQNPTSTIPALSMAGANNEGRSSTYFLESGSYLKLRNVQLGYDLKNALKKLKLSRAKIYVQASNLLRFKSSSYTAPDPENPGNAYPIPVVTTIGINLSY